MIPGLPRCTHHTVPIRANTANTHGLLNVVTRIRRYVGGEERSAADHLPISLSMNEIVECAANCQRMYLTACGELLDKSTKLTSNKSKR